MTRWTKFITRFLIGMAVLVGLNWGLQAQAQFRIPGIPNIPVPVDIPAEIPGLDALLSKEPALTTSLEDAQQEIPFLDNYNPDLYKSLRLLPRTTTNGFQAPPGDYAFNAQSYCLRAGTHGPGSGDGYLYAPLEGSAAGIVQNVLRRSVDHPEISQQQVQVLLWAIIAQTDLGSMPGDRQRVARTLLSDQEFARLSSGALGQIPDQLLRRALQELPPVAQKVFEANARIRSTITRANSSFEELEQIAVLLGEAPRTADSREIPAQRWSYHPEGYFIRYQPSGYSRTEMHVSVPQPFRLTRDGQGRITEIMDSDGNQVLIGYDEAIAPLTVSGDGNVRGYALSSIRLKHQELLPPEEILSFDQTWSGQGWTFVGVPRSGSANNGSRYPNASSRYQQAVAYQQQQSDALEHIGIASNPAALKDLADVYHLQQALAAAIAPPANSWKADQLASLTQAWQYQLCRHAGACSPRAENSEGTMVAAASGIYLAQQTNQDLGPGVPAGGGANVDPAGGAAVPGITSKQRLGQSSRPLSEDEIPPTKDPQCAAVGRELAGLKRNQAVFRNPQVKELARINDLDGYGYNKLVKETIAQQRDQGDDYSFSADNQRAAMEAVLSESDDTSGSRLEVPAYTNGSNCKMNNGDRAAFVANGRPGVIHDAYVAHEQVHKGTCEEQRDPDTNPDGYLDYMADIDNYSQDEIDAYQASIDLLQQWLDENC